MASGERVMTRYNRHCVPERSFGSGTILGLTGAFLPGNNVHVTGTKGNSDICSYNVTGVFVPLFFIRKNDNIFILIICLRTIMTRAMTIAMVVMRIRIRMTMLMIIMMMNDLFACIFSNI